MNERINVGLLDSGLRLDQRAALGDVVDAWKGKFSSYDDLTGHGTACARLIRQTAPAARIHNVKIFDRLSVTSPALVLDGMQWCLDNGVDVINVSISIAETGYYHHFVEICNRAVEKGVAIVAAADSMGRPCLPAYLKTVFGVGVASLEGDQFYYRPGQPIQFYTGTGSEPVPGGVLGSGQGSSFATARMTGVVARMMAATGQRRDVPRLQDQLATIASPVDPARILTVSEDFDFDASAAPAVVRSELASKVKEFGRTVLFGSALDTRLFTEHSHLLQFPLVKLLAAPTKTPVPNLQTRGATAEEVVEALTDADTLILGHVDERLVDVAGLLTRVRSRGKNVFALRPRASSFSNALGHGASRNGSGWMCTPDLDEHALSAQLTAISETHIPKSQIPILAVVHLGGQRLGRLKIELALREGLSSAGNRIGQIGSAPYSELFGCEFSHWSACVSPSFPAGLRVALSKVMVETLNYSVADAALLVVGCDQGPCPSSLLTRDFFTSYSIPALSFLFGVQPDAVIAVVDELTDAQVARRNVDALRGLLGRDVLFVVHDSPLAAYASALGQSIPPVAPDFCPACQSMRQALSVPLLCAGRPTFVEDSVRLVTQYFGIKGSKMSTEEVRAMADKPPAERPTAERRQQGSTPNDGALQAARRIAEGLQKGGNVDVNALQAARQIAERLRQGDKVDSDPLQAVKQMADGLQREGKLDVNALQAARQIAELFRGGAPKESFSFRRLKIFSPFVTHRLPLAGATLVLILAASAVTMPAPLLQMQMIDRYLPTGDVRAILGLAAILLSLYVVGFAAKLLLSYTSSKLSSALLLDVKKALFERVLMLPMSFFSDNQSSYLAARVNELDRAGTMFSLMFTSLVVSVLTFLFAAVLLAMLSWQVFAIALVCAPVQYMILSRLTGGIRGISKAVLEKSANLNRNMQEVFAGMSTVKAFAAEQQEASKMDAPLSSLFRSSFLQSFALRSSGDIVGFASQLTFLVVLVASMLLIIGGNLTLGAYVAVVGLVEKMYSPLQALATTGLVVQPMLVAMNRVAEYFEALGEGVAPGRRHSLDRLEGNIEFRNVEFTYPGKPRLLRNASFTIRPGERVAVIGPNGSGKTTLMKLLLQLYLPSSGSILIDDRDASAITLDSLRRRVGLVSQDVFLFNDTILNNLLYGGVVPRTSELDRLVDRCCAFVKDLPEGLQTRVGEGGATLSGGQRQAVSIVRALLKAPDVLVIDEGTAHLDRAARETLRDVVLNECSGKTCILISHDPGVIALAGRVLVVDGGSVSEADATLVQRMRDSVATSS